MKRTFSNRSHALVSATVVLALSATVGWSQSLTWLGTLGGNESAAYGVSADGAVVVGYAFDASGSYSAFRWTQAGGMQSLGTLGGDRSAAWDASANGAVVVGWAHNASDFPRAFRWTQAGGMQDLGTLGGYRSVAYGVSADGAVVVGWAEFASSQQHAFRWTQAGGMEDLNATYASLLTGGSNLIEATAISPDGRYIVGVGFNAATGRTEAFLLHTRCDGDVNGDGVVDDADLLIVLFNFGSGC